MTSTVVLRFHTITVLRSLCLGATLLGANALAQAPNPESMDRQAQHTQRTEQGLQRLEKALQLTPEQNTNWLHFKAQMAQSKPLKLGMSRTDGYKAMANMRTPERLLAAEQRHSTYSTAMRQRHQAILSFYADLNPEQQVRFDAHSQHQRGHGVKKMGNGMSHSGTTCQHKGQKQSN